MAAIGRTVRTDIGGSDFPALIECGAYYVDKTRFIRGIVEGEGPRAICFTRPRRFGKTLAISMLRSFLEMNYADPSDRSAAQALFSGLDVSRDRAFCDEHLGRWPVIALSLKDVGGLNFDEALDSFRAVLRSCVGRYGFLLESERVLPADRKDLRALADALRFVGRCTRADVISFLAVLEKCLFQHCGKRVIVLIDEYDTPLQVASGRGYYEEMRDLVRGFFLAGLKDRPELERAVFTGCVPLPKESVFPGLSLTANTVSSPSFGGLFGSTGQESAALLEAFGLASLRSQVRERYEGYRFGGEVIYCPWTLLNFCKDSSRAGHPVFKGYWVETSRNDLVRSFLEQVLEDRWDFVRRLLSGEAVAVPVEEEIAQTEPGRKHSPEHLVSLIYCAGYLTRAGEDEAGVPHVKIPNLEVRECFRREVRRFFSPECDRYRENGEELARALVSGGVADAARALARYLDAYASLREEAAEPFCSFCYGHVLGLLSAAADFGWNDAVAELESNAGPNAEPKAEPNAEAGGDSAVIRFASYEEETGVVLEFKKASSTEAAALDQACDAVLAQIKARKDYLKLRRLGLRTFRLYGVAFAQGKCRLKAETFTADALP